MKKIKLYGKYSHIECIVDNEWAEMFEEITITYNSRYAYIQTKDYVKNKMEKIPVHQIITSFKTNKQNVIDHINGDKLDNRSSNLRITTHQINALNRTEQNQTKTTSLVLEGFRFIMENTGLPK